MKLLRRSLGIAVFIGILVLGWTFAARHSGNVLVTPPGMAGFEVALWLALLVAFGSGAALVTVVASMRVARLQLVSRRYRKVIRGLEAEVHQLRNLPLSDEETASAMSEAESGQDLSTRRALGRGA